jgi:hypothetical protein
LSSTVFIYGNDEISEERRGQRKEKRSLGSGCQKKDVQSDLDSPAAAEEEEEEEEAEAEEEESGGVDTAVPSAASSGSTLFLQMQHVLLSFSQWSMHPQ